MIRYMLKSKIHRAVVTDADLNYVGSITLDKDLMDAADIIANEKVTIVNNNNGERFETYVIEGERGSGIVCLNGQQPGWFKEAISSLFLRTPSWTKRSARSSSLILFMWTRRITFKKYVGGITNRRPV